MGEVLLKGRKGCRGLCTRPAATAEFEACLTSSDSSHRIDISVAAREHLEKGVKPEVLFSSRSLSEELKDYRFIYI